jgi:hypothetical protein
MWWSYWVCNLNEERNVVFEDHISLATGRWCSPGPPVSPTNKMDLHDTTEILLKVALNTIKQIGFDSSSYQKPLCHVVVILGV